MARIFITGSSDGLGLMAALLLVAQHHEVILHARNTRRADDVRQQLPGVRVVTGDVMTIRGMRDVAEEANQCGHFDAIIHNVAVGYQEPTRLQTEDGLPHVFAVNVLAPYVLTALLTRPDRLIYLSSGLHRSAKAHLEDLLWTERRWDGTEAYSESKLYDVMLAFAIARRWKDVSSNALEPGWVATKMGGPSATDDLKQAHLTQAWLATSNDPKARVSGSYFYHLEQREVNPVARDEAAQEALITACKDISGISLPD